MRALAFFLVLFAALAAQAQTPTPTATPRPDVPGSLTSGVVPMACVTPLDVDLVQICFFRTDLPGDPLELGCMPTTGPDERHSLELTVEVTPEQDARLRCQVTDSSGLPSNLSDNALVLDFTTPGSPWVVAGQAVVDSVVVSATDQARYFPPGWPALRGVRVEVLNN